MSEGINQISEKVLITSQTRTNHWRESLVYIAWVQALVATLGSLFFSEVMGFVPCTLCWYQRILMYPLVIILTVGILLRDTKLRYYVLPLSIFGLAIALYHNVLHYGLIPEDSFGTCTAGVSCTVRWFEWFGFISIPQLSLGAFTIITVCILGYKRGRENDTSK
jgi:disulfide bond formation protein DsbB